MENHNLKKTLRILHGPGGSAGQPACIATAQSELGFTAHSIHIGEDKYKYLSDIRTQSDDIKSYCEAFSNCADKYDVFHFYFRPFFYNSISCSYPVGLDILTLRAMGKTVIMHFRGSEIRLHSVFKANCPHNYVAENPYNLISNFPEENQKKYIKLMKALCNEVLVTDPELLTYCPGATIVPRAIDLSKWPLIGTSHTSRPPLIVHAPSRRVVKGTHLLISTLERLKKDGIKFRFKLVEDLSNDQAMEIYRKADIVVDQLRIGWYGVLGVECMAMGKPVLSYIRKDLRTRLPDDAPIVATSPVTIYKDLKKIIESSEKRQELSMRARSFVEAIHDSKRISRMLIDLYVHCQANPKPLDVDYLGKYINSQHYYRQGTETYHSKNNSGIPVKNKNVIDRFVFNLRYYGVRKTVQKVYRKIMTLI